MVEARAALAHAGAIKDIANAYRDPLAGRFRLGIIASLGPFLAPDLFALLQHDAPRLDILLTEGLTDTLLLSLRDSGLDAVLVATPAVGEKMLEMELFDEPFLLAHAPGHPLAGVLKPTIRDIERGALLLLDEGHCLRDQALDLCGAASVDIRVKATSLTTLIRLAASGLGVTLVPALAAGTADGLVLRPLNTRGAKRRVRLVARRNFPRTKVLEVIANAARNIARANRLHVIAGG